ncbi:hypothetical protein [Siminovitchia fortis]|uniref:hypothetical protein n=2 Tax=Siminovitchia fortis TaxID=254758 RepID=UPI001643E614|nr:hypothetical protein [Siminovitchia fortis]
MAPEAGQVKKTSQSQLVFHFGGGQTRIQLNWMIEAENGWINVSLGGYKDLLKIVRVSVDLREVQVDEPVGKEYGFSGWLFQA